MASPDDPGPRSRALLPWLARPSPRPGCPGAVFVQAISILGKWEFGIRDTRPTITSTGPTMVQLERLQYLVSTRVNVADVLVGESRWLEGSWIIQGDALIGVDMSQGRDQGQGR